MRKPLPPSLHGKPFSRREAMDLGVGEKRLRSPELGRPFHGVRIADSEPATVWQRIRAYQRRMPEAQIFTHTTAAIIHGLPLPLAREVDPILQVSAQAGAGFPRALGIAGHHTSELTSVVVRSGCRLSAAVDTWCDLASVLGLDDLIAVGDFLITGDEPYSGKPPIATRHELELAVRARAGRRGIRQLSSALGEVKYGAMSRMETLTRLLLARSGLPEPALNQVINNYRGGFVAMVDLAFPDWKVAVEYQGEHHREKARFRQDITRRERIEDEGWTVVYVSADDILRRPAETLARIRSRLRARGAAL